MLTESTSAVNNEFNAPARVIADGFMDHPHGVAAEQDAEARNLEKRRWNTIKNRMADEISGGFSVQRLANETGLKVERIEEWAKNFEFFRVPRRIGEDCESVRIEAALEARFNEIDKERDDEKKRNPARIMTSVTREVMDGISMSREMSAIVDISAPPGSGKSQGVAEYMARARKAEGFDCPVWLIELSEFSLSKKSVLRMIARACISANYDFHDEASIAQDIADKTQGRGGVLIIEEAQHLGDAKMNGITVFNGLRRFVDAGCFGLVLIGNGELYRQLKNGKHAQLLSRMSSFRKEIIGITDDDVDNLMAAWGVSGKAERALCLKIAKGPGALRSLAQAFRRSLHDYGLITLATLNKVPKG